jgi:OTU domain-containing protein 3
LSQPGPRISVRDKKDIKKQAQKAARKERQQQASTVDKKDAAKEADASNAGLSLHKNGLTQTPPVETLRTLYI